MPKHETAKDDAAPAVPVSPLQGLMQAELRTLPATPDAAHTVVLGTLLGFAPDQSPLVSWPAGPAGGLAARSLVPLHFEHVQAPLALSLLPDGQALVLGLLWQPAQAPGPGGQAGAALQLQRDGQAQEHLQLDAQQQLTLRCGQASITLTADGQILLRGQYISSHASGTQRIKGAAVRIN